ncbi:cytochrome b5 domain-containing protein [Clostridium brassicae]|uniref:Cytochrome b5 heme-binding domain-containing protein n=1 Tax=Clostridium brassicae TaxID=2999072 RepID=A0ABT4DD65_9CLOT|nr:cytochrome b5 domain-containing protein [Clostridium brassicae]MCY6960242.1 hypothetical protein [Clostridium brassicae]
MYFSIPYYNPYNFYRSNPMHKPYRTLEEALILVKESIQHEKDNELFYNFLISLAPTKEEKGIFTAIQYDKRKHNKYFKEIYKFYTDQNVSSLQNSNFEKPKSYINGIKKARLAELDAFEIYRDIRSGLPDEYYRNMVFEILTDELTHADKYDYILHLNLGKKDYYRQTKEFTLSELAQYDGTMGNPAYVAVNGIVYDVSNISKWKGGTHYGLTAGKDLSSEFEICHGVSKKLEKLPKVGILKG